VTAPDDPPMLPEDSLDPRPAPAQEVAVVLTAEADSVRAEALARELLERRLVACVSLLPVRSIYRWQGRLEAGEEVKLLLKTTPNQLEGLHQAVLERHSYEVPEWIVLHGSSAGAYGFWLAEQLG